VRGEEYVEPVSTDGAASVENFYRLVIVIAGNDHFGTEGVLPIGRRKGITRAYSVTASCHAI